MKAAITVWLLFFSLGVLDSLSAQTPAQPPQQPEFTRQGQQLIRNGKPEEALALFRKTLRTSPDSFPANIVVNSGHFCGVGLYRSDISINGVMVGHAVFCAEVTTCR